MSDFPRGWTLTADASGAATLSLVIPAVAGVVHVLDSFFAFLGQTVAAAAGFPLVNLNSSDGVFTNFPLGILLDPGGVGTSGTDADSGLDLAAGPGASLTISFAVQANAFGFLRVKGRDI